MSPDGVQAGDDGLAASSVRWRVTPSAEMRHSSAPSLPVANATTDFASAFHAGWRR